MGKGIVLKAVTVLSFCVLCTAGCSNGKLSEDNASGTGSTTADHIATEISEENVASKILSAEETEQYKESCRQTVQSSMDNNDDNTNRALESIEAEFGDLKEVTSENYGASKSFSQFALDCTYLDMYMEEDSPGDEVGTRGLKFVSQILQGQEGYEKTLKNFQIFYSDNIEELYDHCYYTGRYVVGDSKITAGEYVLFTDNPDGAAYTVYADADGGKAVLRGTLMYNIILSLKDGECLEMGRNCKAVPIEEVTYIDEEEGTMFKTGTHLDAGTYTLSSDGSAAYIVYGDSRQENIIAKNEFDTETTVTVKDGEYLFLDRCNLVLPEEE